MSHLEHKKKVLESLLKHNYAQGRTVVQTHMSTTALQELGAVDYGNRLEYQIHVDGQWRTMQLVAGQ